MARVESASDVKDVSVESGVDPSLEPDDDPSSVVSVASDAAPLSVVSDVSDVSGVDPSKDEDHAKVSEVVESAFEFPGVVALYSKNTY